MWPRLLVALLLTSSGTTLTAQESDPRVAWLRDNALVVSSPDAGATTFADLEPFRQALAGVDVVLLGEAGYGDGTSILAKARLVHFLHREMGFDVLALQCGLFDGDRAWRRIRSGAEPASNLRNCLPIHYANAAELQPMLDLVAAQAGGERPLTVAGFDSVVSVEPGAPALLEELASELARLGVQESEIPDLAAARQILRSLSEETYFTGEPLPSRAVRKSFEKTLAALASRFQAAETAGDREAAFWRQLVASLGGEAESTWKLAEWEPQKKLAAGAPHIPPEIQNLRFRQMGENLLWLHRQRYAGRKMIVWGKTLDLTRDLDRLTTGEADVRERFDRFRMPGDFLTEALKERAYLLAFTAGSGRIGRAMPGREPSPLLTPTQGSFEDLMSRTGLAAAIVDLRATKAGGEWLSKSLIARPISHKELLGIWPRHVDGFFFLRSLEPASRAPR